MAKLPKKRKILLSILLVILLLPVFLHAFLKSPAVQTYLSKEAANFLSKELNTVVKVGGVDIEFFLDVVLNDVYIEDQNKECLLYLNKIVADVEKVSLLKNRILIDNIQLDHPYIGLRKYKEAKDFNLQFILDYFSPKEKSTDTTGAQWDIVVYSLNIVQGRMLMHDYNKKRKEKGLDFSNLDVDSLNLDIIGINLLEDTTLLDVENFTFKEASGLKLNHFSSEVALFPKKLFLNNFKLRTPKTDLALQLSANFNQLSDLFADSTLVKSRFNLEVKPSTIFSGDIAYFVPPLEGMNEEIHLATKIRGRMSSIRTKYLEIYLGNSTRFKGDFSLNGLPDINETFVNFSIDRFITTANDLKNIGLPGGKKLSIPKELANLGAIKYNGNITGFVNDFVAYGELKTQLGDVSTDIGIKRNVNSNAISYNGKISANEFSLGSYFDGSKLGTVSMETEINGSGLDFNKLSCMLKTNIHQLEYNNYNYQNLFIEGEVKEKSIKTKLLVGDRNLRLDLIGKVNLNDSIYKYTCNGEIEKIDLAKLNLSKRDTTLLFGMKLDVNLSGNNPDFLNGHLAIEDFSYAERGKQYELDSLFIFTNSKDSLSKSVRIESDILDLNLSGKFKYNSVYPSLVDFVKTYAPALPLNDSLEVDSLYPPIFNYSFNINETRDLLNMFAPDLSINPNTLFYGDYDGQTHTFTINGNSSKIKHKKNIIEDFNIVGNTEDKYVEMILGAKKIFLSDSIWLDNLKISSKTQHNTANFAIEWSNIDTTKYNKGNIRGKIILDSFPQLHVKFDSSEIVVNDSLWRINNDNDIFYDTSELAFRNLKLYNDNQELIVNGVVSKEPNDLLEVNLDNFDISNFDAITVKKKLDFDGLFTGDVKVSNIYKSPYITTDIFIEEFVFNDDRIGDLTLNSIWDNKKKAFNIDANIIYRGNIGADSTLKLDGYFYPQRKKDNFDLSIDLKNFKLEVIKNYVKSFGSNLKGLATGNLKLKGSLKEPELTGDLRLVVRRIKIDYLNEFYRFSDVVRLRKDYIAFDSIDLFDNYGNKALCHGKLYHDHFKNMRVDMKIKPEKFACMNTNSYQNELFYGKAYASGLISINGSVKDVMLNISAKTEKNTRIFIPISSSEEISQNDFIQFTSKEKDTIEDVVDEGIDLSGFALNFNLNVDPQSEIQIILDATAGDIIKAKGNANLNMEIDKAGDFKMYGEYIISQGDYLFTLENVINKRFKIEQGGKLSWNGDPYDASMDLKAIYKIRTSLYELGLESDTTGKRVPVECVIYMKNKLFSPEITFDIEFPAIADEFKKSRLKEIIDPNINRQFLSLIVMNKFSTPDSRENRSGGNSNLVGTNTSELLSNQLSNWLSQISSDFDIGINYRPGDDITSEEVNVALSTQLFNNRVEIDGNIGYEGDNPTNQQVQNSSNIVGDVNIEYKVNEEGKVRVKAFNRSNQYDLLNTNSHYTQGVGVVFRREFNSLRELFRNKKKRAQKEKDLSN